MAINVFIVHHLENIVQRVNIGLLFCYHYSCNVDFPIFIEFECLLKLLLRVIVIVIILAWTGLNGYIQIYIAKVSQPVLCVISGLCESVYISICVCVRVLMRMINVLLCGWEWPVIQAQWTSSPRSCLTGPGRPVDGTSLSARHRSDKCPLSALSL